MGARKEDDPSCQASNHFHNPSLPWNESGLTDTSKLVNLYCLLFSAYKPDSIVSNIAWATGLLSRDASDTYDDIRTRNEWDFESAREYFYVYLTGLDFQNAMVATNAAGREDYMAKSLRAVGQTLHLLQDTAVPAHVRNDFAQGHTMIVPGPDWGWVGNAFELYVKRNNDQDWFNSSIRTTMTDVFMSDFWDTTEGMGIDLTISPTEMGLAEYTNINFFSEFTVFEPLLIYPNADHCEIWLDKPSDGIPDIDRKYIRSNIGHPGDQVKHLLVVSSLYHFREKYFPNISSEKLPVGFDPECYNEYAEKLIPRAIGYSADLIDYFFRGTIEISAPDTFVYGVIDGSISPHQFTHIKVKIRNTTPNEEMQAGTLVAVAKYRKRLDYDLDLSTDPPIYESSEEDFSYSVSESIAVSGVSSSSPAAYTFDFTNDPIPAGVTDLYLQVVFKGTLGNEADIAVAVGMTDLNEPQHLVFWNCTDYFLLDGEPRKAADIENDPEAASYGYIRPYSFTENVGFSAAAPDGNTPFVATFENLPPGRYGKLIVLTDAPSDFWVKDHLFSTPYDLFPDQVLDDATFTYTFSTIENQTTTDGTWQNTPVYDVRGVMQHQMTYFIRDYPIFVYDPYSIPEPDIDNGPFPATIVFP